MPKFSPSRRTSIVTVSAVLFLAFTVLGWGTGYKLSLYEHPAGPVRSIPAAKLLSERERPSATQVADAAFPKSSPALPPYLRSMVVVFALTLGLQSFAVPAILESEGLASRKRLSTYACFFSFRPPPALLPCP